MRCLTTNPKESNIVKDVSGGYAKQCCFKYLAYTLSAMTVYLQFLMTPYAAFAPKSPKV